MKINLIQSNILFYLLLYLSHKIFFHNIDIKSVYDGRTKRSVCSVHSAEVIKTTPVLTTSILIANICSDNWDLFTPTSYGKTLVQIYFLGLGSDMRDMGLRKCGIKMEEK